jgi:hypothetical protein
VLLKVSWASSRVTRKQNLPVASALRVPLKTLLGTTYRAVPRKWRYGDTYERFLDEAKNVELWSPAEIERTIRWLPCERPRVLQQMRQDTQGGSQKQMSIRENSVLSIHWCITGMGIANACH